MENEALSNNYRRDFLVKSTSVVGGAGWPQLRTFRASMNPSSDVLLRKPRPRST